MQRFADRLASGTGTRRFLLCLPSCHMDPDKAPVTDQPSSLPQAQFYRDPELMVIKCLSLSLTRSLAHSVLSVLNVCHHPEALTHLPGPFSPRSLGPHRDLRTPPPGLPVSRLRLLTSLALLTSFAWGPTSCHFPQSSLHKLLHGQSPQSIPYVPKCKTKEQVSPN